MKGAKAFRFAAMVGMLCLYSALLARGQTVVTFDNPPCNGNGIGIYGGIDFSQSPWGCEKNNLPSDSTETISWYKNITSGTFKFLSPSVLTSLWGGASSGSGTLTISTDAGETISRSVSAGLVSFATGFTKAASVVTVNYTGGWTVELDNIAYIVPASTTLLRSKFTYDDGTAVAGSVVLYQVANPPIALANVTLDSTGLATASVTLTPTAQYHGRLLDSKGNVLLDVWTDPFNSSIASAVIQMLPMLEAQVVLSKANPGQVVSQQFVTAQ